MRYLDLKLGYKCNNNCLHCVISDQRKKAINLRGNSNRSTQECKDEILTSKKRGCQSVTITGGEPTIRKDFLEIVEFVKNQNLKVELQSNGRAFHYDKFAKESSKHIDFYMIALHSHKESIHDKITQKENSFKQTIQGIKNLINLNCNIGIKIVLSKYNYNDLENIIKLVSELGVKYANIAYPHLNGNAMKNTNEILVRYNEINDSILQTINWAEENNFNLDFEQILPCALNEEVPIKYFSDLKIKKSQGEIKQLDSNPIKCSELNTISKRKNIKCNKCIYNNYCEGYWKEYIDKFGFEEFNPITKLPIEIKKKLIENINSWN